MPCVAQPFGQGRCHPVGRVGPERMVGLLPIRIGIVPSAPRPSPPANTAFRVEASLWRCLRDLDKGAREPRFPRNSPLEGFFSFSHTPGELRAARAPSLGWLRSSAGQDAQLTRSPQQRSRLDAYFVPRSGEGPGAAHARAQGGAPALRRRTACWSVISSSCWVFRSDGVGAPRHVDFCESKALSLMPLLGLRPPPDIVLDPRRE